MDQTPYRLWLRFLEGVVLGALLTVPANAAGVEHSAWMAVDDRAATVTVWAPNPAVARQALLAAQQAAERLTVRYSLQRSGSWVNRVNQAADDHPVVLDGESFSVLQQAWQVAEWTQGAWDPTAAAYRLLYGFASPEGRVPSPLTLQQVKPLVNYRHLWLEPKDRTVLFKRAGMRIDLDDGLPNLMLEHLAAAALAVPGVQGVRIRLAEGAWQQGQPTPSAESFDVPDPLAPGQTLVSIPLGEWKILRAGINRHGFIVKDRFIHPYLDVHTGEPARYSREAVLILSPQTPLPLPPAALLLMPAAQAIERVSALPGAECWLLTADNQRLTTPGWPGSKR